MITIRLMGESNGFSFSFIFTYYTPYQHCTQRDTIPTVSEYSRIQKTQVRVKYTYLLMYGAEPFLRSCQLCSHSGNSQQF
jgi:hypothetical protein